MATRIISFQQIVQNADPDWQKGLLRPWIYEFSNGRLFYKDPNVYDNNDIVTPLDWDSGYHWDTGMASWVT